MPSERIQRQIDALLDEAEQAIRESDWALVRARCQQVLALDPGNGDAMVYLTAANRAADLTNEAAGSGQPAAASASIASMPARPALIASAPSDEELTIPIPAAGCPLPAAFVGGRYTVKRFLGEGGKKQVYLAHDTLLDRDVAFALIKTEGLDAVGRQRITREAQAMGRLGAHPHIVSVFDLGEEAGQPYIVTELMGGGDVEGLLEKAPEHRPPLARTLEIGIAVCRGLEFAHRQGIVHRDLKPGNVWLTADGTAKLGDFGLAVALDKSRLTQGGMMVGTVSYMPPEQAMGGAVTPQADLYSLGAMLYELVTGRPPFVGDESVAIITQHLNVAPVAPSWHNPSVPQGLEVLILRLLEKDASKRPASAAEVGMMLEGVAATNLSSRPPSPRGKGENGVPLSSAGEGRGEGEAQAGEQARATLDNPMYRRAFVGREAELRQLQSAYDAAVSGQGALAMVVGEPGIGKTALCEQLATFATIRGGKTLVGHCYEEGSLSLPYLPFVEAMRSYVLAREPDDLRKDLGSGVGEVARIVSEIRDRLQVDLPPAGAPEDDRWRLLQAVTSFLRNAASVQSLVLVLEDLHDADRGTLDLLQHLSHNLAGARLLIVGTYRDVEVDRAHPLSATLAELRRSANFLRVPLRGLTAEEVQRMLASVSQQEIPWPFAELVHRQTEGNPLFVQEMLRFLVEEGLVERREGALRRVGEETLVGRIPEGLRDVIGKRLSRLAEKTNQVLSVASVIGREFRLDVLTHVLALPEEELYGALEEATSLAVVEQRRLVGTVGFRFTHAFFRQTLYEEIFIPRRIRWHQQIGRALEGIYGRRLEEHAAELAEHFAQSTEQEDLEKALRYSELAAQRSLAVFAYGEGARHLEQALKAQDVLDPDDKVKRCDLLLELGQALLPSEEPLRAAHVTAPEAFALAESLQDSGRASRAAVLALESMARTSASPQTYRSQTFQDWTRRADHHATMGSRERIYTDAYLGLSHLFVTDPATAHVYFRQAGRAAMLTDDNEAFFMACGWPLRHLQAVQDRALLYELTDAALHRSRQGARTGDLGICLHYVGAILLERGEREAAERVWADLDELAARTHDTSVAVLALHAPMIIAFLDGRFETVLSLVEKGEAVSRELGSQPYANRVVKGWAVLHLGKWDEAESIWAHEASRPGYSSHALALAHLGRHDEARAIRARFGNIAAPEDESAARVLGNVLETAVLCSDAATAKDAAGRLEPLAQVPFLTSYPSCIARHLGDASVLLGDREAALRYYDQALEVAGKVRFRPEIALTHLGIAELLLDDAGAMNRAPTDPIISVGARFIAPVPSDAQRAEALQHLDIAIAELREMKMQPALERALRHKEMLKA